MSSPARCRVLATWIRARIDENAELRRDYEGFCKVLDSLSGMSAEDETGSGAAERVDVLASVQKTLHARSRGKFYRTRVSRMVGILPLEAVAVLVLILLVVLYASMTLISSVRPAGTPTAPAARATTH